METPSLADVMLSDKDWVAELFRHGRAANRSPDETIERVLRWFAIGGVDGPELNSIERRLRALSPPDSP
jgi:hypothetical protein